MRSPSARPADPASSAAMTNTHADSRRPIFMRVPRATQGSRSRDLCRAQPREQLRKMHSRNYGIRSTKGTEVTKRSNDQKATSPPAALYVVLVLRGDALGAIATHLVVVRVRSLSFPTLGFLVSPWRFLLRTQLRQDHASTQSVF